MREGLWYCGTHILLPNASIMLQGGASTPCSSLPLEDGWKVARESGSLNPKITQIVFTYYSLETL